MKGKKKTRKNKKQANNIKNEVISISIIALSLFLALSIYASQGGFIGYYLNKLIIGISGISGFTIPIVVLIIGFLLLKKSHHINNKNIYLLLLGLLDISALAHIIYYNKSLIIHTKIPIFNISYFKDATWQNGGLFGALLGNTLLKLVGLYGSYIILISMLIIIVTIGTKISLINLINKAYKNVKVKLLKSKNEFLEKKAAKKHEKELLETINKDTSEDTKKPIVKEKVVDTKESQDLIKDSNKISNTNTTDKHKASDDLDIHISKVPTIYYDDYELPSIELLEKGSAIKISDASKKATIINGKKLEETLMSFGVEAKILNINKGPTVTRYELQPKTGVKVSKIVNLADDIALNLAATDIRIEAPIPGKSAVGIEVPNSNSSIVKLREVIESNEFINFPSKLAFALGKDIGGKSIITDISKMPHLLIAGATGSGKSVCINTLIISILYKAHPSEVKLIMIDPKVVELNVYNGIPHLLIPVVTDPRKASSALFWAVQEMTTRYKMFADNNVRDISGYNEKIEQDNDNENNEKMPHIVIIIDELADLMMSAAREVEDAICRLAQMARAAGIHLVIATQRPSVDVITGVIKANIPSRLAFSVSSGIDSRTILDMNGAEKLLGKGDMLFYPVGAAKPVRIQGAYVSDKEVENIVNTIKSKQEATYEEDIIQAIESPSALSSNLEEADDLLEDAIKLVVGKETASISFLQRSLRVGFNRASRIMDSLEELKIVGPDEGSKPRKVLITSNEHEREDIQ